MKGGLGFGRVESRERVVERGTDDGKGGGGG